MIRLALILLAVAAPATAETARVYSGEHGNFTRLVIELPAPSAWIFGRTADGYAFAAQQDAQPEYDLADVWQRISRARASAITTDPDTGVLRLSLGCDCHILPFEYRPGVVVLDIKPGEAPTASAFEAAFETGWSARDNPDPMPKAGPAVAYNWIEKRAVAKMSEATQLPSLPLPLATGGVSLDPLRDELLEQLARGAANGIVELGLPMNRDRAAGTRPDSLPWTGIRIGEQPGITTSLPAQLGEERRSASTCTDAALLDIAAWGEGGSPSELLAAARSGLYGEFDIPDHEALVRSVRLHLHLGFGAEAVQLADLADGAAGSEPLSLYRSMGRIVDGEPDPGTPFAGMLDCDGPAALWAALAHDRLPNGPGVNRSAILRAFQALPPHLRSHLGSGLADRFLAIDDSDAARMIRDAMARAPHAEAKTIALLDASNELHLGNAEAARRHAAEAVALDGNQAKSLVTLVEAHFRELRPIGAEVPDALQSLRGEIGETDLGAGVGRAIVLSLALSNQIDAAFASGNMPEDVLADLWQVAVSRADDDAFLRHAVLPEGASPPKVAPDLDLMIAERLLDLGFPDAASVWIGPVSTEGSPQRRVAAARALLGQGDARSAIEILEGMDDADSASVRALALLQLDDLPAAADALLAAGKPDDAARVGFWQGRTPSPGSAAPDAWKDPALSPLPVVPAGDAGLLARASATVEASLASRAAIEALLQSVAQTADD